ncbi:MAG: preprotein translocase subunit Sec61beta [Candidatus Thermoplasmatota archaeon]|nr:preprotein translocase subunit Sec61beta [Candidatus Thermoplasmatota archaeon]
MPPKKKKGEGFHSGAGLIRYFDAEDELALKVDPRAVLILCVVAAFGVEIAKYFWPT